MTGEGSSGVRGLPGFVCGERLLEQIAHDDALGNDQHQQIGNHGSADYAQRSDVLHQDDGQRNVQSCGDNGEHSLLANAVERCQQARFDAHETVDYGPESHGKQEWFGGDRRRTGPHPNQRTAKDRQQDNTSEIQGNRSLQGEGKRAPYPGVVSRGVSLRVRRPERRKDERLQHGRQSYEPPGDAVGCDLGRAKIMADDQIVGTEDDHGCNLNQEKRRTRLEQLFHGRCRDEGRAGKQPGFFRDDRDQGSHAGQGRAAG